MNQIRVFGEDSEACLAVVVTRMAESVQTLDESLVWNAVLFRGVVVLEPVRTCAISGDVSTPRLPLNPDAHFSVLRSQIFSDNKILRFYLAIRKRRISVSVSFWTQTEIRKLSGSTQICLIGLSACYNLKTISAR